MPSVASRGRGRRTINEINMVPFIDVMLVLLIIFMVSAPMMTTAVVDLPSVGKGKKQPDHVIEVVIGKDERIKVRLDGKDVSDEKLGTLAQAVKSVQGGDPDTPVVIAADRNIKYDLVIQTMDALKQAGVARVGLSVKSGA